MRLLHRPPETPSLETWLSRDVPHEREMAGELLNRMGRENALAALLVIHDREETKRQRQRRLLLNSQLSILGLSALAWISGIPGLHLLPLGLATFIAMSLNMISACVSLAANYLGFGQWFKASQRQQNTITTLFDFDDNPLIADALCRALAYYFNEKEPWALFKHLSRALALLPDDKETLTKEARFRLRNRLLVLETKPPKDLTNEDKHNRAQQADFEIDVLRYFARTRDKQALSAIRKLAKAKAYSDDGVRVRDAARAALQAFGESTA